MAILGRFAFWPVQTEKAPPQRRTNTVSGFHLGSTNQRERHRLVLAYGHIIHQAAPERFIKFRNRLGQLFQFGDKPLELPPADSFLPDLRSRSILLFFRSTRGVQKYLLCSNTPTNPSLIRIPGNWHRKSTGCAVIPAAEIITKSLCSGDSWFVWTADSRCEPVMNRTRGKTAWSGSILPMDAGTTSAVEDRLVQHIVSICGL